MRRFTARLRGAPPARRLPQCLISPNRAALDYAHILASAHPDRHADAGGLFRARTPASPNPAVCALCGVSLCPPTVATAIGTRVHLACAERAALQAWRCRRLAALAHGLIIVSVVAGLAWFGVGLPLLLALLLAWLALHGGLHRRFWHYLIRDLRRWLLGRS